MKFFSYLASALLAGTMVAQSTTPATPASTDPKAEKAYRDGMEWQQKRDAEAAISSYKKAVKLDPSCLRCGKAGIGLALAHGENKDAWEIAALMETSPSRPIAELAIFEGGVAYYREGAAHNKANLLEKAHAKFAAYLDARPNDQPALYADGMALAYLKKDDDARERFKSYLDNCQPTDFKRSRIQRYLENPQLARERLAPTFSLTTLTGDTLRMDDLQGKVVLLDFWATWCGPCNQELPHIKEIAAKYANRPLVVISISWDKDEAKWKDFIAGHGMTWAQYRDADHQLSNLFNVDAIPHYFTIDTDTILQSEQLGTGNEIDGKLKKLVSQAEKRQAETAAARGGR
jgi:thiol-disulfide isomerase/thioredoxin